MAIRPKRKLTYGDYVNFPDDGRRWEIMEGEAFVVPSPDWRHQGIVLLLARWIADHLDHHPAGRLAIAPLDVLLPDEHGDVVQPDIVFIAAEDADRVTAKNVVGAPTWIIEVVSDPVRDKKVKRDLYMRSGVREYWAVDPELRQIEIHHPGEAVVVVEPQQTASPRSLPGLEIDLVRLFASLPGDSGL